MKPGRQYSSYIMIFGQWNENMGKIISLALITASVIALSGCSKPPEQEMNAAIEAMDEAKSVEAEKYAPAEFQKAVDTLNAATALKLEQDSLSALTRSYTSAKNLFISAQALAKSAAAKAVAEKQRIKVEVERLIEQAEAELTSADSAIAAAPVSKGNKAKIELAKGNMGAARNAFDTAKAEFEAGDYLAAKPKIQTVIANAQEITTEIAKVVKETKGAKRR